MSDDKKYYYLKLKDNFFDSDEIIVIESMADGYLYCNILLKLYLRSLKNEGKLMFNDSIPYNSTILARLTRQPVGVIEKALNIFQQFGLMEILDNGAIYILDIQNYIGQSSSEADRQRDYQRRINSEKGLIKLPKCKKSNKKSNIKPNKESNSIPTPEIERELELDREIDITPKVIEQPPLPKKNLYDNIFQAYNNTCKSLSQIKSLSKNRKSKLKTRIEELKTIEAFQEVFNKVEESNFLKGDNPKGWKCTFDWLIDNDNNYIKVLEGAYTNKINSKPKEITNKYKPFGNPMGD